MSREGLESILREGWPFLVLKVEASPEEIQGVLERFKGRRVKLRELVNALNEIDKNKDVRVATSFSPIHWWDPEAYGYYAWPSLTLMEQLGDLEVEVVPWGSRTQHRFWTYSGVGIASYREELRDGIEASAVPMAFALAVPRIPRNTAVIVETPNSVDVFTAQPRARSALRELGYAPANRVHFTHPVPSHVVRRSLAQRTKHELSKQGLFTYLVPAEEVPTTTEQRTAYITT